MWGGCELAVRSPSLAWVLVLGAPGFGLLLQSFSDPSGLSSRVSGPEAARWRQALCWVVGRVPQRNWGAVCRHALKGASLSVICWQLGCGEQGWLESRPVHSSLGTSWVDNIQCRQLRNSTLWQCPSAPWHPRSCPRGEEV